MSRPRRRLAAPSPVVALAAIAAVTLTSCTSGSGTTPTSGGTATAMPPASTSGAATTGSVPPTTQPSVTPVTVEGMFTGPGIDDASISLGLIADPDADRGFTAGVTLWQDTVNTTGGICARTVQVVLPTEGATADEAYTELGRNTLGLITLEPGAPGLSLATRIRSDQIPALTPEGTAEKVAGQGSPVVLGATDDILAINTAAHLLDTGAIADGSTLGVLVDDSAGAADALAGLTWWADTNEITLRALEPGAVMPDDITAVFAATDAQQVADLLAATGPDSNGTETDQPDDGGTDNGDTDDGGTAGSVAPGTAGSETTTPENPTPVTSSDAPATGSTDVQAPPGLVIATTLRGYDPDLLPEGQGDRLLVATVTPAPGADHPAVQAVDTAYTDAGLGDPGPRMLAGYATGQTWGRLLKAMCSANSLTRKTAAEQLAALAPAAPDSLLGPADPALQVSTGQPASRVSAISVADPSAPAGLRPVTLLESAPGIGEYRSG